MTRRKKSRFERRKILELRAKINGIRKPKHKLFAIFDDSRDLETGYSIRELSAALNPKDVDINGEPTFYGQFKTKVMIRKWRKEIVESHKKGITQAVVVPFATNTNLGWLYYNIQTKREFKSVVKLGQDVIDGIENLLREFLEILDMNKTKKDDVNDEFRENIRRSLLILKKAKSARR